LHGGLLEVGGHKLGTTWLPKDHFRQSCFSRVFKELGGDTLQSGSYCSYPVTGPIKKSIIYGVEKACKSKFATEPTEARLSKNVS
jgi:hypothetical protein